MKKKVDAQKKEMPFPVVSSEEVEAVFGKGFTLRGNRFDLGMDDFFGGILGQDKPASPRGLSHQQAVLVSRFLSEEHSELLSSVPKENPQKATLAQVAMQADALVDTIVFCVQGLRMMGLDPQTLLTEVHRANMAKKGGKYDSGGKFRKPAGWRPPCIERAIINQYCRMSFGHKVGVNVVAMRCVLNDKVCYVFALPKSDKQYASEGLPSFPLDKEPDSVSLSALEEDTSDDGTCSTGCQVIFGKGRRERRYSVNFLRIVERGEFDLDKYPAPARRGRKPKAVVK